VLALLPTRRSPAAAVLAFAVEDAPHRRTAVGSAVTRSRSPRRPRSAEAPGPRTDRTSTACTKSVTTRPASGLVAAELAPLPTAALGLGPPLPHPVPLSPPPVPPRGLPAAQLDAAVRVPAVALTTATRAVPPATASPQAPSNSEPSTAAPPRAC